MNGIRGAAVLSIWGRPDRVDIFAKPAGACMFRVSHHTQAIAPHPGGSVTRLNNTSFDASGAGCDKKTSNDCIATLNLVHEFL